MFLTVFVIAIIMFSGPAKAIDVSLITPDIDVSLQETQIFTLQITVNDGEFLPILYTNIEFNNNGDKIVCHIDSNNEVSGCDFLSVDSMKVDNLNPGYGYGYQEFGYGYGYGYGYQEFGYGYGYGYGEKGKMGEGYGVITYTLLVNVTELPASFTGKTIKAVATVYGGNPKDYASFKGSSSFKVSTTEKTDEELVNEAYVNLTFKTIQGSNDNKDNVISNLNLININSNNVMISWNSSDVNIINPYNGKVTRPSYGVGNRDIKLIATLSKGEASATGEFSLIVLEEAKSDYWAVEEAYNALNENLILNNQNINAVTNNLNLVTKWSDNTKISWSSSNTKIITSDGSVSRPQLNSSVVLSATISKGSATKLKQFNLIVKGTTDIDEWAVSQAKLDLTEALILNGNVAKDKIMSNLKLPINLSNHENVVINWSSSNANVIAINGAVTRSDDEDKDVTLTASLTKNSKSTTKVFSLTVKKNVAPAVLDNNGNVDVKDGENEILIDNSNAADIKEITIPSSVSKDELVSLNLNSLVDQTSKTITLANDLVLNRATSDMEYKVEIPKDTKISGGTDWNGLITLPTLKAADEVSISVGSPEIVLEVGSSKVKLTFDKATRIVIPGQAGKSAGYELNDVFYTIPVCIAAQIDDPDTLPEEGDCYVTSGTDLIIWTKHFTKFVSYTPTSTTTTTVSSEITRRGGGVSPIEGIGLVTRTPLIETTTEEIKTPTEKITTPSGEGFAGITSGAIIGTFKKTGVYLGITALVLIIIFVIGRAGKYIRKNRGIYF